jgi:hypothetical protein
VWSRTTSISLAISIKTFLRPVADKNVSSESAARQGLASFSIRCTEFQ